jgi:hypothetical protein
VVRFPHKWAWKSCSGEMAIIPSLSISNSSS